MVDKCTLFTSHTYICIYSYKIQNTVDCHPDNGWATIPCLLLAPWLASWLVVFCCLTSRIQLRQLGYAKSEKSWYGSLVRSSHLIASQNGATVPSWHFTNIPSSFRQWWEFRRLAHVVCGLCFWGVLTPVFRVITHKTHTTCTGHVVTCKEYSRFWRFLWCSLSLLFIYTLHGTLSGHKQRRQRKLHHPDRLRTSPVHWGSWIEFKNEFSMFIICDLRL